MKAVWAGEEQNKPLISREMCCIDVLNVVQAQGMLLQCLPCGGGYQWWGPPSHPIPVLLITSACLCCDWAPKLGCSAFNFTWAFPPVSFLCTFDVGVSKELCDLAAWQWGCLQGVPYVRNQANHLPLVRFPLLTSCIQTSLIQISSEFVKFCLKNTQRYW